MKNLHGKRVTPENAHEVWQSGDGTWTYFVLKKYQHQPGPDGFTAYRQGRGRC
jgi:hypothetical protein